MFCWSERCVAHCLLRALVGCAGLGATAPSPRSIVLPEKNIKYRRMKRRDEWLVKWKNYPTSKNTWDWFSHFMTSEF
ncbi:hypothetical protein T492DRAFT_862551 [Pavlovales sp. CCMP2436]|nr:hypothetical protein T492DRAFT_862551 [Pavlovales sp. CCMP2436]